MSEYNKLFECVRPDFINNIQAIREEDQGILKLSIRRQNQYIDLYGFGKLGD